MGAQQGGSAHVTSVLQIYDTMHLPCLQSEIKVNFMHDRFLWLIEKFEYELVWDWLEELWG